MRRFVLAISLLVLLTLPFGCVSIRYPQAIARSLERGPEDFLCKAVVGPQSDGAFVVATTQVVAPAGKSVTFPGRPTDLALSPDGKVLAVKTTGRAGVDSPGADIVFLDMARQEVIQFLELTKGDNNFCGIAWSRDGQTLWTTDAESCLRSACRQENGARSQVQLGNECNGTFAWRDTVTLPGPNGKGASAPGGLHIDEARGRIYVALS